MFLPSISTANDHEGQTSDILGDVKMRVKMIQHPVGQGGLFSATLDSGIGRFRFVYDCGGNVAPLKREINLLASNGSDNRIDMLFLSHLHEDHVRGVYDLISSCDVKTVVLPYLNVREKQVSLCKNSAWGRPSNAPRAMQMIQNSKEFFRSQNIIYFQPNTNLSGSIRHAADDNYDAAPFVEEIDIEGIEDIGDGVDEDGRLKPFWIYKRSSESGGWAIESIEYSDRVCEASSDRAIVFCPSGILEDWILIPYVHSLPRKLVDKFLKKARSRFGSLSQENLKKIIANKESRSDLRGCYSSLDPKKSKRFNDNVVSMTLYSGPFRSYGRHFIHKNPNTCLTNAGGWILTGDANFKDEERRNGFLMRYLNYRHLVNIFMIPHHGSKNNFDESLLLPFGKLIIAYVAVGNWNKNYKHPNPDVRQFVERLSSYPCKTNSKVKFVSVKLVRGSHLIVCGDTKIRHNICFPRICNF